MAPRSSNPRQSVASHRSTLSLSKTEVSIHVYDLLPRVCLRRTRATRGDRGLLDEAQDRAPGGTFKSEILHGFTFATQAEIDAILEEASKEFLGTSYNLLTKNCNHFTSYLCKKLTGRPGPGWLNHWIDPPEYETADGALLEDDDDHAHEGSRMLKQSPPRFLTQNPKDQAEDADWDSEDERRRGGNGKGKKAVRDTAGRDLPAAERAPDGK
ncbi:UPF0326 protein hag1 [Colletotrichum higginsianum]|nr:UPF0326 protein hag1 [Colletotrichum higginsianum]